MAERLFPIAGINNVQDDDVLKNNNDAQDMFVRDAVNLDITSFGKLKLRRGGRQVTADQLQNLWQSPLHKDVFATRNGMLVLIDTTTWITTDLQYVGDHVCFEVINNLIYIHGTEGIFTYNGATITPLTIDTPAKPLLQINTNNGALSTGMYSIAISWLRNGIESGLSHLASIDVPEDDSSIDITLPYCLDQTVTHIAVYLTERNGTILYHYATLLIATTTTTAFDVLSLGKAAPFQFLSPMPVGRFMRYWNGRLTVANKNVVYFSEALAYHLHDQRHGYIMLPQRVSFMIPVDGGIWVGQTDRVAFLSGAEPKDFVLSTKSYVAPVYGSAIKVNAEDLGANLQVQGAVALWLSDQGYMVGTADGQVIAIHAGKIKGVSATLGRSVSLDRRITTLVS